MTDSPKIGWCPTNEAADWGAATICPWPCDPVPEVTARLEQIVFSTRPASAQQWHRVQADTAKEVQSLVARAVTASVIPRLALRHSGLQTEPITCGPEEVTALTSLVLTSDLSTTTAFVHSLRARGMTLDDLYLHLLTPVARRLGELWASDLCSFVEVTSALGQLTQLVQVLRPAYIPRPGPRDPRRRAALVAIPGEQHTFGLAIVTEFFVQAGWEVWSEPVASSVQLVDVLRTEWFAVLGLSVASDTRLPEMPGLIHNLRAASRNPAIAVIVGGWAFRGDPGLGIAVGANASAPDGRQAALQAEALLSLQAARAPS
ncbi:cobalamin B12-binding domain-containing protein [Paracraurococcus ruber]|uniref:B12-binding domain-containing protein n=1 Tax=Paracraurococcus ruber TaxID=77675 RepID=A0ABS1D622_9PROT|nr:cobalamin B12-binding domain-containing protein [Paracraurococcus ruber]MBK1662011.1 hypothetical protein [Paracraurococcus ruber]TDG16369.1 cobalamin B12-binding domain-containing protein [Paracraurococcus ruber]